MSQRQTRRILKQKSRARRSATFNKNTDGYPSYPKHYEYGYKKPKPFLDQVLEGFCALPLLRDITLCKAVNNVPFAHDL